MKKKDFLRLLNKREAFFVRAINAPIYVNERCSYMGGMNAIGSLIEERDSASELVLASPMAWRLSHDGRGYGTSFFTKILIFDEKGEFEISEVECIVFQHINFDFSTGFICLRKDIELVYSKYSSLISHIGDVDARFSGNNDISEHLRNMTKCHNALIKEKETKRWTIAAESAKGLNIIPRYNGLQDLLDKLGMPALVNNVRVQIGFHDYYDPTEYQIRYLQIVIRNNPELKKTIRVFDKDEDGEEYEMEFNPSGKFKNKFTSNFYNINNDFIFEIL